MTGEIHIFNSAHVRIYKYLRLSDGNTGVRHLGISPIRFQLS